MTSSIEKAIAVILVMAGMPLLAAFITKIIFADLGLAFIAAVVFFIAALVLIDKVLKEPSTKPKGKE